MTKKLPNKVSDPDSPLDLSRFVQRSGMSNGGLSFPERNWAAWTTSSIPLTGTGNHPLPFENTYNNPNAATLEERIQIEELRMRVRALLDKPNLDIEYCMMAFHRTKFPRRSAFVCREGMCASTRITFDYIDKFLEHAVFGHQKQVTAMVKTVGEALQYLANQR